MYYIMERKKNFWREGGVYGVTLPITVLYYAMSSTALNAIAFVADFFLILFLGETQQLSPL